MTAPGAAGSPGGNSATISAKPKPVVKSGGPGAPIRLPKAGTVLGGAAPLPTAGTIPGGPTPLPKAGTASGGPTPLAKPGTTAGGPKALPAPGAGTGPTPVLPPGGSPPKGNSGGGGGAGGTGGAGIIVTPGGFAIPTGKTPAEMLMPSGPGGPKIGKPGGPNNNISTIRVITGGQLEAETFFRQLSAGGTDVTPAGTTGRTVIQLSGGGYVTFRTTSSGTPAGQTPPAATIDVNIPGITIREIKFVP